MNRERVWRDAGWILVAASAALAASAFTFGRAAAERWLPAAGIDPVAATASAVTLSAVAGGLGAILLLTDRWSVDPQRAPRWWAWRLALAAVGAWWVFLIAYVGRRTFEPAIREAAGGILANVGSVAFVAALVFAIAAMALWWHGKPQSQR